MDAPEALLRWRKDQKLSQVDAATKAGVHQNTWSDWETGRKAPRIAMALRLHVLTRGACPVWSWTDDAALKAAFLREIQKEAS